MKSKTFLLACFCFCTLFGIGQKLPRYFRFETPGCPVDPLKEILKGGLFRGNPETVQIYDHDEIQVKVKPSKDLNGNPITIKDTTVVKHSDTFLLAAIPLKQGVAFDVVKTIGNYSIIRLWPRNINETIVANLNEVAAAVKSSGKFKVSGVLGKITSGTSASTNVELSTFDYIVPTSILLNNSVEFENKFHQWNIGVLAMPVKVRPFATESGQFEFLDGVSLGTTFAWTLGQNRMTGRTASIFLYAGLSSFTVDSSKIKDVRDDYKLTTFSPGVGFLIEKSKIQLSLMTGFDFPAGQIQQKWVYRNMPWVSVGLGFSLFKIANDESTKTGTNK